MHYIIAILAALLLTTSLGAEPCCRKKRCLAEYFNAYFGTGYRQDSCSFNLASDADATVSTARDTRWKELRILPFYGYTDYRHPCGFILKLYGDYGRIYDGKATNDEYLFDGIFSFREKALADRGSVWDLGGGIGYQFRLIQDYWTFTPMIGYDHNQQYYRMYEVQRLFGPNQGLLGNQHHSYQSLWRGPWAGAEMKCGPWFCEDLWLRFGYDWHYMLFRAKLKDTRPIPGTPVTIACERKQKAHGQGNHFWGGFDYHCRRAWSVGVFASYKDYDANSGSQISKCNDATLNRKVRFNRGNWHSFSLLLTIGYHWP